MSRRAKRTSPPPAVDDRIVQPGTRAEILRGELLMVPPADEPHATRHCDLAYVLRAHVAPGYAVAIDMLTRTSEDSDFAPDASVYPAARNSEGKRQLEELAFEVAASQSIGVPSEKARELVRRGVRRVFCVLVKKGRVVEWSRETDAFGPLRAHAEIVDRCLSHALPIAALLDAAAADAAVIAALLAREPALRQLAATQREEGREEGRVVERRRAVADLCEVLGIALSAAQRAELSAMTLAQLELLTASIKRTKRWPRGRARR